MNEVELYRRYMELGKIASDAEAERKNLRDTEIAGLLESGVVMGENGRYLKYRYDTRTSFDLETALTLGYLTKEQAEECTKVKVIKVLYETKMEEAEAEREAAINAMRARLYVSIGGVPTFDGEPVKVEVKA